MSATRDLFGGAITAILPSNFIDASDLRQVPDSQEVWLSPDSDLSFILEVLQLVTEDGAGDSLEAGIKYHFNSLAHDNDALSSSILHLDAPSPTTSGSNGTHPTPAPAILHGTQLVSKFNRPTDEADTVLILVALWRLPEKNSDLVLTVNWPLRLAGGEEQDPQAAQDCFEKAVHTLAIKDMGLFAG